VSVQLPALDTAATRFGSEIQLIPGRTRGYLHPNSEVMRVRMAGAAAMMVTIFNAKNNNSSRCP